MNKLRGIVYKLGYSCLRLYWFLIRPHTYGVRCIVRHQAHVLLIQHTYGPRNYSVPGGGMRENEEPEQAARREVFEEVGINLTEVRLIESLYLTDEYKRDTVYVFTGNTHNRAFQIDDAEIANAEWYPVTNLPDTLSPQLRDIILSHVKS